MLKNRLIYLFVIIIEIVCFAVYNGALALQVLILTLVLPLLSFLLLIIYSRSAIFDIHAPSRVERGKSVSCHASVRSKLSMLGICACVHLTCAPPGRQPDKKELILQAENSEHLLTLPYNCGTVSLFVSEVHIFDLLGLFCIKKGLNKELITCVYPVAGDADCDLTAAMSAMGQTVNNEIYELRDYRPGDALRMVHWKLSSKTDRLLIKEPQASENAAAVLTVHIMPPGEEYDAALDELLSSSIWLLRHGLTHMIAWQEFSGAVCVKISCMSELYSAFDALLSVRYTEGLRYSGTSFSVPEYHFGRDGRNGE